MYVSVPRATDAGYSLDIIDTYRKAAIASANENGDEKLAEKIAGGSFGGGLKFGYGHALYMYDMDERAKGLQLLTLSHSQFKDLDERKFKLWQKSWLRIRVIRALSVRCTMLIRLRLKRKKRQQDRISD